MGKRSGDASLGILTESSGDLLISDTNAHTGNFDAFTTVGSTVIAHVFQKTPLGTAVEKSDLAGKTITDGKTLHPGVGDGNPYVFTSIQLTSGSVIATYQANLTLG